MANIGDLWFLLRGEDSQLELDAERAAAKAGDKASKTFNQRLSSGLKGLALTGLGAAAGAAMGMAAKGAAELDTAMRSLQAETGMTDQEAQAAAKSLASMYGDNLQGFDEIGQAMARVHNDLGLTGEAADAATARFLKYATATKQDAAGAVSAFDDILDAWNLTAEDSASVMDGLIADHQRFGGSIADTQAALAAMAPAMQAANMSIDDGRALLNLFNASGIDASKASAALAKAVKELKPGQSLDDLIARIGAIEDPVLRGQEAMRVFGARSGIGLAQAIRPGMTSLDAFAVSATDAAGATDAAAGAIESGFGAQFQLMLKKAGGALSELGQSFGPLLMVAAQVGPSMIAKLSAGLGAVAGALAPKFYELGKKLGIRMAAAIAGSSFVSALTDNVASAVTSVSGSPKVAGAVDKLGNAMGSKLGKVVSVAFAAVAAVELYNTWQEVSRNLRVQAGGNSEKVAALLVQGSVEDLERARKALLTGYQEILQTGGLGVILSAETRGIMERDIQALTDELNRRAAGIGPAVAAGVEQGAPEVEQAAGAMYGPFFTEADKAAAEAERAGENLPANIAAGILAQRAAPVDAMSTLRAMLKTAMTPMAEVARLRGQLTSKALARGLKSGDPAVRAQAQAVAQATADRLGELAAGGGRAGRRAMHELNRGIRSGNKVVSDAAKAAKDRVMEKLDATKGAAGTAGTRAGNAFATNLRRAVSAGDFSVNASVGFRIGGYATGAWNLPANQLALVHQGEMIVPSATAAQVRAGTASIGGVAAPESGGGATVFNFNFTSPAMTPGVMREFAELVGPALTRWQQARGV